MIKKFFDRISAKEELSSAKADEIHQRDLKIQALIEMKALELQHQAIQQQQVGLQMANTANSIYDGYANSIGVQSLPYTGVAGGTTYCGQTGGSGGTYCVAISGTGNIPYVQQPSAAGYISGIVDDFVLIDADGNKHNIRLDRGFMSFVAEMNYQHQAAQANRPKILPDPDFDLDEMERASELVGSLEDGSRP